MKAKLIHTVAPPVASNAIETHHRRAGEQRLCKEAENKRQKDKKVRKEKEKAYSALDYVWQLWICVTDGSAEFIPYRDKGSEDKYLGSSLGPAT